MADNFLIHPTGQMYTVPEESMQDALQAGYQIPTAEQKAEFANEQKYSGVVPTVTAFTHGFTEGALPFVGNALLNKLVPGAAEISKQLEERHPIATTAGQIAGLITDPVGVFGLLGKGTKAAERSIAAAGEKMGAGALGDVAAKAAGYGLEGAGIGVANVSNDYALGDPSLTAEKAINEIGFSALLAGGFGAGAAVVGKSSKAVANAISKHSDLFNEEGAIGKLKQSAIKSFAEASSLVSGKSVDEIVDIINNAQIKEAEVAAGRPKDWFYKGKKGVDEVLGGDSLLKDIGLAGAAKMLGVPKSIAGPIIGTYRALQDPALAMRRLVKLQELISKTNEVISSGTKALVNAVPISAKETAGFVGASLSKSKYDEISNNLRELTGNPEALISHMSNQLQPLSQYAPAVADQAHVTGSTGISFLASKLPAKEFVSPLETAHEVSPSEIFKFSQYYNAVNSPLDILKNAKNGTLTSEQIEAIATVYPKLYSEMQKSLLSEIVNKKNANKIPYQHKLMISMMLGKNIDKSLSPMSIMTNQIVLGASQMQQNIKDQAFMGQPKARAKGLDKLNLGKQSLTPMQRANQRIK